MNQESNTPTKEQLKMFESLHNSRTKFFKTINDNDFGGIWDSVVNKYPESAHFVYELLQNADDAEATMVTIKINHREMLFKHNGTKHFNITTEDTVPVGDINSITGIGDSSKNGLQNKIGKFGVGFKAVFQYADTPEIYDDIFKFKIENYIIPTLLTNDHPFRKNGETLFVIPFKNEKKSFDDIKQRLVKLQNPILFLRHLKRIEIDIDQIGNGNYETLTYEKRIEESVEYKEHNITLQLYKLIEPKRTTHIFLFSRPLTIDSNGRKCSHYINVGFYYDSENKKLITNTEENIYCFFPTEEKFKTCFVCHAPFLLTDNRQNLKLGESLNQYLVKKLSEMAAETVVLLRDYGKKQNILLIDKNITEIIPSYKKDYWHNFDEVFEEPMKTAFDNIVKREPLLLSRNGEYLLPSDSYIGTPRELVSLINKQQLNDLCNRYYANADFLNWDLAQVLDKDNYYFQELRLNRFRSSDLARKITSDFMSRQDMKWVLRLYSFLRENAVSLWRVQANENLVDYSAYPFLIAPIIKCQDNKWIPPYNKDKSKNVYLPLSAKSNSSYNFIHEDYSYNEDARKFFDELGIKEPDEYDYIKEEILNKYQPSVIELSDDELNSDLSIIINYYSKIREPEKVEDLIKLISDNFYLRGDDQKFHLPKYLFFERTELKEFVRDSKYSFLDQKFYSNAITKVNSEDENRFF